MADTSVASPARIEKHRAERDAILRAAFRLIGSTTDVVSVQDILSEAGLSTRAFYRHFRSKDALILTMYRTASDRVDDELRAVATTALDPIVGLTAWIHHQLAVVYDPRRLKQTRVLTSAEVRSADGFDAMHHEALALRRSALAELIRTGQHRGIFASVTDPDEDARAVLGAVGALIEARMAGQETPEWAESAEHLTALFLRAFGVPQ